MDFFEDIYVLIIIVSIISSINSSIKKKNKKKTKPTRTVKNTPVNKKSSQYDFKKQQPSKKSKDIFTRAKEEIEKKSKEVKDISEKFLQEKSIENNSKNKQHNENITKNDTDKTKTVVYEFQTSPNINEVKKISDLHQENGQLDLDNIGNLGDLNFIRYYDADDRDIKSSNLNLLNDLEPAKMFVYSEIIQKPLALRK